VTHSMEVTVDGGQHPTQLRLITDIGEGSGFNFQFVRDLGATKGKKADQAAARGIQEGEASSADAVESVLDVTATVDLTNPANLVLARDFLSQLNLLNDQVAGDIEAAASSAASPLPTIDDPLGRATGILQDGDVTSLLSSATVSAVQLQQSVQDKGFQVHVGEGIAFGLGFTDKQVVQTVQNAVYRDPNGPYWSWGACTAAGQSST
jgi:hypothetical protein